MYCIVWLPNICIVYIKKKSFYMFFVWYFVVMIIMFIYYINLLHATLYKMSIIHNLLGYVLPLLLSWCYCSLLLVMIFPVKIINLRRFIREITFWVSLSYKIQIQFVDINFICLSYYRTFRIFCFLFFFSLIFSIWFYVD